MNDTNFPPDDGISALADGVLAGSARAQAAQRVLASAQGLQTWHSYHVIGDVLRSAELAPHGDDYGFWDRLSQKIAHEPGRPTLESVGSVQDVVEVLTVGSSVSSIDSANDATRRWKLVAGVACAALGGVLGYGLWGSTSSSGQLAAFGVPPPPVLTVVDGRNGVMLRDPQLDSLMAAHQQVSGHSALQLPTGFLRNATYEGSAR